MKILVLNAGSSSLKFNLFEFHGRTEQLLQKGTIERVSGMADAVRQAFAILEPMLSGESVAGVGHRVVHGGDQFSESVVIDSSVEKKIESLSSLAPLHNVHSLEAYRAARERLPDAVHVAAFDTAFHTTLPPHAYVYGLPYEYLTEKKIRRYGFHGISHRYVSQRFAELQGKSAADYRLITCHLGNGCSVCAIDHGRSIDTSMGFTPLEGLVMGTRSGDIDAAAVLHLVTQYHEEPARLLEILNSESGLKGISGISGDMRDVLQAADGGESRARLAIDVFCYRVRKYIGAYLAAMNGADALIFTGGIGENAARVRAQICAGMSNLGIAVDQDANTKESKSARRIGKSVVEVWVVPTDEELLIARDTAGRL